VYLRRFSVTDFRSWPEAELELDPGVTVLVGSNGVGKTNLVEADRLPRHLSARTGSPPTPR
jgi:DNA replication and repair protein RecF